MIVRILTEGQFEVGEDQLAVLNELDAAVETAVEAGDEQRFAESLAALLDAVRTAGAAVANDSLVDSDLILPPADASIDEVREMLQDDGLIPGR